MSNFRKAELMDLIGRTVTDVGYTKEGVIIMTDIGKGYLLQIEQDELQLRDLTAFEDR